LELEPLVAGEEEGVLLGREAADVGELDHTRLHPLLGRLAVHRDERHAGREPRLLRLREDVLHDQLLADATEEEAETAARRAQLGGRLDRLALFERPHVRVAVAQPRDQLQQHEQVLGIALRLLRGGRDLGRDLLPVDLLLLEQRGALLLELRQREGDVLLARRLAGRRSGGRREGAGDERERGRRESACAAAPRPHAFTPRAASARSRRGAAACRC
jgi:hypothetical protein